MHRKTCLIPILIFSQSVPSGILGSGRKQNKGERDISDYFSFTLMLSLNETLSATLYQYKHRVLADEHKQTVITQIRNHRVRCLTRVSSKYDFLKKYQLGNTSGK